MTKKEISWILYDVANSAYTLAIMTAIMPIFFKDVAAKHLASNLSTAYWGYVNTLVALFIALLSPILGSLADYKGYKKKLLGSFIILGVGFTLLMTTLQEGAWFLCITLYFFATIGFSGAIIFYDAFLSDVTTEEKMDWLSSNGFAWGYIGSTIPFIISMIIIARYSLFGLPSSLAATKISFLITALWWFGFSIPILRNVNQVHYVPQRINPIRDSFVRLYDTFLEVKKYKHILFFLLAYFFYIDGIHTIIKMATVYGKDIGIDTNSLLLILLVVQIVAFPFAILYGKLASKFSARRMIFVGIGVYLFITIFATFVSSVLHYWILAMLVASSQGGVQALSRSYYCKMIPKEKSAGFFGIYNIFGKFSAVMGPAIVGAVAQITGSSRYGVFSIILFFILGAIFLHKSKITAKTT